MTTEEKVTRRSLFRAIGAGGTATAMLAIAACVPSAPRGGGGGGGGVTPQRASDMPRQDNDVTVADSGRVAADVDPFDGAQNVSDADVSGAKFDPAFADAD